MYKDADKQRAAVRDAVRRHRAKGITKVLPKDRGITVIPKDVTPKSDVVIQGNVATMRPTTVEHSPTCKCIVCSLKR